MSGLSIKITADAASAIQQFNALAYSSESMGDKMAKANEKFAGEYIDKFIDKQKLAQAAITAARGSTEALVKTAGIPARNRTAYQAGPFPGINTDKKTANRICRSSKTDTGCYRSGR